MAETVLLTGAGGFIGKVAARRLAGAGYRVRSASREPGSLPGSQEDHALMPGVGAGAHVWDALVEGVDHVVHCAGVAHVSAQIPASAYMDANAGLTEALALAAVRRTPGRFVFLSSIRAVCGATAPATVTEDAPPAPDDDYGRSKLEAERRLAAVFAHGKEQRLTILRPVLVYGPQMRGNLAALMRAAVLPLPLPFGGFSAKRSLLDVESLGDAILHMLARQPAQGGTYVVCDRAPLTVAGIVTAMRRGLGRPPRLFGPPPALLAAIFAAMGRERAWERLSGPLAADSSRLAATGWRPVEDTFDRLAAYAAASRAR